MTTHAEPRLARRLDMDDQAVLFPVLAEEAPISGPIVAGIREERRTPRGVVSSFFSCSEPEKSLLYVGAGIVSRIVRNSGSTESPSGSVPSSGRVIEAMPFLPEA